MKVIMSSITDYFNIKGFLSIETPYILTDIFESIKQNGEISLGGLNDELEKLGWGIGVLDENTYDKIASLYKNKQFVGVVKYFCH